MWNHRMSNLQESTTEEAAGWVTIEKWEAFLANIKWTEHANLLRTAFENYETGESGQKWRKKPSKIMKLVVV